MKRMFTAIDCTVREYLTGAERPNHAMSAHERQPPADRGAPAALQGCRRNGG